MVCILSIMFMRFIHDVVTWYISNLSNMLSPLFPMKAIFFSNIWNCPEDQTFWFLKHSTQPTFPSWLTEQVSNVTFLKMMPLLTQAHVFLSRPIFYIQYQEEAWRQGEGGNTCPGCHLQLKMTFFWTWKVNSNLQNEWGNEHHLWNWQKGAACFQIIYPLNYISNLVCHLLFSQF